MGYSVLKHVSRLWVDPLGSEESDNQIEAARQSAENTLGAMADAELAGALVFGCACQGAILGERFGESVDEMTAELGVPLAGFQTYGEICMQEGEMRGYHNTTSSVLGFPE